MIAHPIDLIAGMDDGIDLDEKDRVARHIAACDGCRTLARTFEHVDRLIALPEPALPLPQRAMPQQGVRTPVWARAAAVLTLAVTIGVLVGSLRQTQVTATDACGVLVAAARSAAVGAATARASRTELPPSLSGSWTACAYGDASDWAAPWLLIRSEPTEGQEVLGLLIALGATEPTDRFVFGRFVPRPAADGTERWVTQESTRASGVGQEMAVLADPYFFVVRAPSYEAADRLTDAVLAELRRQPRPTLAGASKTDPCAVLRRAAPSAGLPTKDANGSPLATYRHWEDTWGSRPTRLGEIAANANLQLAVGACALGSDRGFSDPHLWIRKEPTTLQQADRLLLIQPILTAEWTEIETGMWLGRGEGLIMACLTCDAETDRWSAVAVSDDPRFFVVTQATDEDAIRLARAVLAELRRP